MKKSAASVTICSKVPVRINVVQAILVTASATHRSWRMLVRFLQDFLEFPIQEDEVHDPESIALIPFTQMEQHLRIVDQAPFGVFREDCPCHVADGIAAKIMKEMDLVQQNRRFDPYGQTRDGVAAVFVRFCHRSGDDAEATVVIDSVHAVMPATLTIMNAHRRAGPKLYERSQIVGSSVRPGTPE